LPRLQAIPSRWLQPWRNNHLKKRSLTKISSILLIIGATLISWVIANTGINYDRMELGALANIFIPLVAGALILILFLLVDWIVPEARNWATIFFVAAIIICGLAIRSLAS
jgi:hypothetical protein